jgi:hypothetical protein
MCRVVADGADAWVDEFEPAWQSVLSMREMAPAADYLASLTRTKASTGECAAAAVAAASPTLALAAVTMQEKWAAAYTHDVFTGGIQSTQRNESMNAFVKSHLTGVTSLEDLLGALDMVMVKEKHRAASTEREPSRLTSTPAEATARSVLTRYAAAHVARPDWRVRGGRCDRDAPVFDGRVGCRGTLLARMRAAWAHK